MKVHKLVLKSTLFGVKLNSACGRFRLHAYKHRLNCKYMKHKHIFSFALFLGCWLGTLQLVMAQTVKPATYPDLMQVVKEAKAEVVVINFWATWCKPCIEEFPSFLQVREEGKTKGVKVVFVSVDFEDELDIVRQFLYKQGVKDLSYVVSGNQNTFIKSFHPEWSGAVPATFIYNGKGEQLAFWEGKVSLDELRNRVQSYLNP